MECDPHAYPIRNEQDYENSFKREDIWKHLNSDCIQPPENNDLTVSSYHSTNGCYVIVAIATVARLVFYDDSFSIDSLSSHGGTDG